MVKRGVGKAFALNEPADLGVRQDDLSAGAIKEDRMLNLARAAFAAAVGAAACESMVTGGPLIPGQAHRIIEVATSPTTSRSC